MNVRCHHGELHVLWSAGITNDRTLTSLQRESSRAVDSSCTILSAHCFSPWASAIVASAEQPAAH